MRPAAATQRPLGGGHALTLVGGDTDVSLTLAGPRRHYVEPYLSMRSLDHGALSSW
jgi:hypothetical protein